MTVVMPNMAGVVAGVMPYVVIAAVIWALFRRMDARLVLLMASVALFTLAGSLPNLLLKMSAELTKPASVVPICSAMGFAYALRVTECDKHLVYLLLRPLAHPLIRALLIPGCVTAGFVVNMAIVSQSGAAAVVGAVLVPLLLSKGLTRATAGSLLLLGCSMGGQLFNPGAVEIGTLHTLTGISCVSLAHRSISLNLIACVTALLVYWFLAARHERADPLAAPTGDNGAQTGDIPGDPVLAKAPSAPINYVKAAVPFVPLLLLLLGAIRPFHLRLFPESAPEHVTILTAMLIGVMAAGLTSPSQPSRLIHAFFDGAGFAYGHIISITVSATLFAEGIKANGLVEHMTGSLKARPGPALLVSLLLPGGLAALSGSGTGPASSLMNALIPHAAAMRLDPVQTGSLIAIASQLGRTMSPVAAVTILCATLTIKTPAPRDVNPDAEEAGTEKAGTKTASTKEASTKERETRKADTETADKKDLDADVAAMALTLVKRVAPALLAGSAAMYAAALLNLGR